MKTREGSCFSETIDTVLRNKDALDDLEFEPADLDSRYKDFSEWASEEKKKRAGARKVILHCDGDCVSFLDMLIEAGIDGINPVEPKAGMDVLRLKKRYGNKLSYIGGVDNAFILPSGDKEKIRNHIQPILYEA